MVHSHRLSSIPELGSGIGYRRELRDQILASREQIDFIEIIADHFINDPDDLQELEELGHWFPIVPHGVGLSIGSPALDADYLQAIKQVSDASGSPYYSEHLAVTRSGGVDIGHLAPMWYTEEVLEITIRNVRHVQDVLQKTLILENIAYPFQIPDATMSEEEFLQRLVDSTDCGVLLDLTNLYTNATNDKFDPISSLERMPLDAVVQLHLAGGYWKEGILFDGHCEPVEQGTWDLLEALTNRVRVRACVLEHDNNFPSDFSVLLAQIQRARELIAPRKYFECMGDEGIAR